MSDSLAAVYDFELTPKHVPTRNIAKQKYVAVGPNQEQVSLRSALCRCSSDGGRRMKIGAIWVWESSIIGWKVSGGQIPNRIPNPNLKSLNFESQI